MTVSSLADQIGCDETTLGRYLRSETKKIGDEALIQIPRLFGVSLDFLMGETDVPERLSYALSDLGLTVKAAQNLCTGTVDSHVVSLLLENEEFAKLTHMLSHYFVGTFVSAFAAQNQMYRMLSSRFTNMPEEVANAAARDISLLSTPASQADLSQLETSFTKAVKEIKKSLELAPTEKQLSNQRLTKEVMDRMTKKLLAGKRPEQLKRLRKADIASAIAQTVAEMHDLSPEEQKKLAQNALVLLRDATYSDEKKQ